MILTQKKSKRRRSEESSSHKEEEDESGHNIQVQEEGDVETDDPNDTYFDLSTDEKLKIIHQHQNKHKKLLTRPPLSTEETIKL